MQSQTLARGIAVGSVLVAAGLVLVARLPSTAPPAVSADDGPAPPSIATVTNERREATAPPSDTRAADKVRELEAMSETFRNTTFIIAIRDAGFVCRELLRVSGGLDGAANWIATCSETMAYMVGVASNGTLRVEPFQQYFDGVGVRPIDQRFEPIDPLPLQPVLPPEPLPQR